MDRSKHAPRSLVGLVLLSVAIAAGPALAHESLDLALMHIDAALDATPDDASLWLRRAGLQRARGDFAGARADLARACALGLAPAPAERERGLNARAEGQLVAAEIHLRRASELAPDDVETLVPQAEVLAELGRARAAADVTARVIALAPGAGPDIWLAHVRALAAAGDDDQALRALDAALARLGRVPALVQEGVAIELRAGRVDAALARLDAPTSAHRPESWRVQRAQILERAGRSDEAVAEYAAALAALESLPPGRRRAPASITLASHAREGIERLARPRAASAP